MRLGYLIVTLFTIIFFTSISTTYSQVLYPNVCTDNVNCSVTTSAPGIACLVPTPTRTRKTDGSYGEPAGYCECAENNKQKCYDRSTPLYDCIVPTTGKYSHGDGSYCKDSCDSGHCLAENSVCYSTGGDFQDNSGCECSSSNYCYNAPAAATQPSCTAPTSSISNNDHKTCFSSGTCTVGAKCYHLNRDGHKVCYDKADSDTKLSNSASDGAECNCWDMRHCITYGSDYDDIKCVDSAFILANNYVSRWGRNKYCLINSDPYNDELLCDNDDQCWHPVNRVCTPHNAYGHGRGECKMSQYILILENQIVGEGFDGEFHPVFIVNSFNDLYGSLGQEGLAELTSDLMNYYNSIPTLPNINTQDYLFAHVKKTFSSGDTTNTIDTFEYWNFGRKTSTDQYQQELIKKGKYLWDWPAANSLQGSEGLFMVFWSPYDLFMMDEGKKCWQYNNASSSDPDDIDRNDIRPLYLKMRYFYKYNTAKNYFNQIKATFKPVYLIKKVSDGVYEEYGNTFLQFGRFVPDDANGQFVISVREILMGFYSPKCE